jgi:hypothetical protein
MSPRIVVFGARLKPLEAIATVGQLLGLTRATAYRQSAGWPLVGEGQRRYVVVSRLCDELGLPYVVETGEGEPRE